MFSKVCNDCRKPHSIYYTPKKRFCQQVIQSNPRIPDFKHSFASKSKHLRMVGSILGQRSKQQPQKPYRSTSRDHTAKKKSQRNKQSSLSLTRSPTSSPAAVDQAVCLRHHVATALVFSAQNEVRLLKKSAVPRFHYDHLLLRSSDHFSSLPFHGSPPSRIRQRPERFRSLCYPNKLP